MGVRRALMGHLQRFTRASSGDVSPYVLLVDDPSLLDRVSGELEDARKTAGIGGIMLVTGRYRDSPLTIVSFGMGGPSLAIVVEELSRVGARVFLKVSRASALSPKLGLGSFVLAASAIRCDKISEAYAPLEVPACGDFQLLKAIMDTLNAHEEPYYYGTIVSTNVFYPEDSVKVKEWSRYNAMAADMETATLYVLSHLKKLRAVSLLVIDSNLARGIERPSEETESELALKIEDRLTRAAKLGLDALRLLHERLSLETQKR